MLKVWTNYRLSDTLSIEGTFGQVQGVFSGTNLWHLDLVIEPWSDKRLSPSDARLATAAPNRGPIAAAPDAGHGSSGRSSPAETPRICTDPS